MRLKSLSALKICFLSLLILSLSFIIRAEEVKGLVFEDSNQNLKLDDGEKGIQGVLVSNQLDVIKTGVDGRFALPVDDETVIFITKPSGYSVPLDKNNLPKFYYIHQPKGSPSLKYKGVDPTGPLPQQLYFPLFKTSESNKFEIIAFADPQPQNLEEVDFIKDDVVAELIGTKSVFGITLGDIAFDELSTYDRYKKVVAQIGIPFYNVPGNHDENYDFPDDHYSLETFKSHFGPTYYSFDYGKVHFIALDDVEWQGINEKGNHRYRGLFGEKQLQWLKNDFAFIPQDKLIVLTMHVPINSIYATNDYERVVDRDKLFEILKNREHILLLAGHMHTIEHNFFGEESGWMGKNPLTQIILATVCGSWWGGPKDERGIPIADQRDGTPNGYHIIKFDGNQYSERFKPASRDANYQMRISAPIGKIKKEDFTTTSVIVNVFDGSDHSTVEFQIDNQPPIKMQKSFIEDPYSQRIFKEFKNKFKSWVKPCKSVCIWTAPLPPNLEPGFHKIKAKTTDEFGNSFSTAQIFEIVENHK